jgi:hypothetical protein
MIRNMHQKGRAIPNKSGSLRTIHYFISPSEWPTMKARRTLILGVTI